MTSEWTNEQMRTEEAFSAPRSGDSVFDGSPCCDCHGPILLSICWSVVVSAVACALGPATEKHLYWAPTDLQTATFLASINLYC